MDSKQETMAGLTESDAAVDARESLREEVIYNTLRRIAMCLRVPADRSILDLAGRTDQSEKDEIESLSSAAERAATNLRELTDLSLEEIFPLVSEGYPVVQARQDGSFLIIEEATGRRYEVSLVNGQVETLTLQRRALRKRIAADAGSRFLVAQRELQCDSMSAVPGHGNSSLHLAVDHEHPTPFRRFFQLLRLDRRDIWTLALFALVAGVLALATPLAVEALVNVVSWGSYLQPLLVLAVMLLACLGLAGILKILQTVVVEIIQQRQLVRIVGDLAHRFPRAQQASLEGYFPRELANRVFDIMTIQKATSVLLLDGISIVLTTVLGLLLLAFYHPFLLGFDLILVFSMLSITWLLGRGGIRTAIDESIVKYRIAHWLQDVISFPTAFKVNGGASLAVERANQLSTEYIRARQDQFRVVIRQVAFAIGLQVVASTALLGLGGWLVIRGQLTLGQLVASELVVTVVVGAFAKAGKALEKYYDLMAGIDKVGHLLDIPVDPFHDAGQLPAGPATVRWENLNLQRGAVSCSIPSGRIEAGERVAIAADDLTDSSLFAQVLAGLLRPRSGLAEVAGGDAEQVALAGRGEHVAYAGRAEVFRASLQENIDLGRSGIGRERVRQALRAVGLWDHVLHCPAGLETILQTDGYPLTTGQLGQLMIARAMAGNPRFLIIDGLLDTLTPAVRQTLWQHLSAPDAPWTLLVITHRLEIAELCDRRLPMTVDSHVE